MIQLYVFAQQPPTPDAIICPVFASHIEGAVKVANRLLGVSLSRLGGGNYTDGTRNFFLYYGEKGMEQFGQHLQNEGGVA